MKSISSLYPISPISRVLVRGRLALLLIALCFFLSAGLSAGTAAAQTADDHGDTFATATTIPLGSSMAGRIDHGDDHDVFKIDLSGASGLTDVWAYATGEHDTVGGLYDSDRALLSFSDDGLLAGSIRSFSVRSSVPPGIYYVVVASFAGEPGDYTMHAQAVTDPGSSTGTAALLVLGSPTGGTMDTAEDADYFRLYFPESTHAIIEARTGRTGSLAPITAELLDAQGREISANVYPLILGLRFWHGFKILDDFGPGTYYLKVTTPVELWPRPATYTIYAYEDEEYTEYTEECEARSRALNDPQINDPLYACQWHLNGPDYTNIGVESAWAEGAMGEGVTVAVVDDGLDPAHVDLRENVNTALNYDYTESGGIYDPFEHHGTHVSGIIAARDNGVGVRGVAPRATIYGYNFLAAPSLFNEADAMSRNAVVTAVSNNSWGPLDGPELSFATSFWEMSVNAGIITGYDGKGTFYVFSGGNGHLRGDDSNLDELVNYFGVTAVCSVNTSGNRAGYSEMGANLWVCAPSNNRTGPQGATLGILTTENSDRYVRDFGGTSAAAPIVSGVAALMRSANPELTWRDLKLILAASAVKNDADNSGWAEGARRYRSASDADRYQFNHEYGFGLVDAGAAVALAKGWTTAPPLQVDGVGSGELSELVPDAPPTGEPTTVVSELTLDTGIGFTEFVEVNVAFLHSSFRDLDIELESPSGAVSKLAVHFDTFTDYYDPLDDFVPLRGVFRFGSARHLGEDPNGVWKLRVTDRIHVVDGAFKGWNLIVYGHAPTPDAPTVDSVTPGAGSLAVAWTAPAPTTGSEVTAYDLRHIQSDADKTVESNWTVVEEVWTAGAGDLEYAVTGLTGGTGYDVQLRAINEWGAGAWSAAASATPQNALPMFNEGATTTRSVAENTPRGGNVGDPVAASDDDALAYTLAGPDAALFEVASDSGQIRVGVTTTLDFEDPDNLDHEYQVTVTATDPSGASASVTVTIAVTNLSLGEAGDTYDIDHNEMIDRSEALAAVKDYFDDLITTDEVIAVVLLYFAG